MNRQWIDPQGPDGETLLNVFNIHIMNWFIVGYAWCPRFQHAQRRLLKETTNLTIHCIPGNIPNQQLLNQIVHEIIAHRVVIGSHASTSPQIICIQCTANRSHHRKAFAICIPGDDELNSIANLHDFVGKNLQFSRQGI